MKYLYFFASLIMLYGCASQEDTKEKRSVESYKMNLFTEAAPQLSIANISYIPLNSYFSCMAVMDIVNHGDSTIKLEGDLMELLLFADHPGHQVKTDVFFPCGSILCKPHQKSSVIFLLPYEGKEKHIAFELKLHPKIENALTGTFLLPAAAEPENLKNSAP